MSELWLDKHGVGNTFGFFPGTYTKVPEGLEPRILDQLSELVLPKDAPIEMARDHKEFKARIHRSNHFHFGVEASQYLLRLATEDDLIEQCRDFAPHPFEEYTFSMYLGLDEEGDNLGELLVPVRAESPRGPQAGALIMPWGQEGIMSNPASVGMVRGESKFADFAWLMTDAFRLLMAQPRGHTINKGGPPRPAIRKGRRVHFYSASEVTVDLDATTRDRITANTGQGRMMPVYQFRAHLCHSGGLPKGCEHEWIEIGGKMTDGQWVPDEKHPRNNATWECYHCGRRRWHRRAGFRGSAEVGYVRQTYRITKGKD